MIMIHKLIVNSSKQIKFIKFYISYVSNYFLYKNESSKNIFNYLTII